MQIKMRKVLAVLACVAMLCTLLPLSVFAADVNIAVPNGDFESSDLSAWKIGGGSLSTTLAHNIFQYLVINTQFSRHAQNFCRHCGITCIQHLI